MTYVIPVMYEKFGVASSDYLVYRKLEADQEREKWGPVRDVVQEHRTEKPQTISCQLISFF